MHLADDYLMPVIPSPVGRGSCRHRSSSVAADSGKLRHGVILDHVSCIAQHRCGLLVKMEMYSLPVCWSRP